MQEAGISRDQRPCREKPEAMATNIFTSIKLKAYHVNSAI
jgi:hypothetical protein